MSSSLLNNRYLNKLDVNRLQANEIKSNNILSNEGKSYLFSAILNNVEFKQIKNNEYDAELIFSNIDFNKLLTPENDIKDVIAFTDRPFRQSTNISILEFIGLFVIREPDSFKKDPPNAVLSFNNTQKSYTMSLASHNKGEQKVIFNLKLLEGEEHTQENFTGTINMFVDNSQLLTALGTFLGIVLFIGLLGG